MARVSLVTALCIASIAGGAWQDADVPPSLEPDGAAVWIDGTWMLSGAGADIWNQSDEFHFLYESVADPDEFAISCHVRSFLVAPNAWSKVGLMARAGAPIFSGPEPYAYCLVSRDNGARLQFRPARGAAAQSASGGLTQFVGRREDLWITLVRDRTDTKVFRGYAGVYPPFWLFLGTVAVPEAAGQPLYLGVAVTSHESGELAEALVDSVNLNAAGVSAGASITNLVCAPDASEVHLTWTNGLVSYARIALAREDVLTGKFTDLPSLPGNATASEDAPGAGVWRYWIAGFEGTRPTSAASCQTVVAASGDGFIDAAGFVRSWLMLGPLGRDQAGGTPSQANRLADYIASDGVTQDALLPKEGDEIVIDLAGPASAVQGPTANGQNPEADEHKARWYTYHSLTDTIDHTVFYGGASTAHEDHVVYHVCYLENANPTGLVVNGAIASDDSLVVMVDKTVVCDIGAARGYGLPGTIQNRFAFLLPRGEHRLLVKVFDGVSDSGMRLRLEHPDGRPVTAADGLIVRTAPARLAAVPYALPGPSDLTCVSDDDSATLTWTNNERYARLALIRESSSGVVSVLEVARDATEYLDTGLTLGTWRYALLACGDAVLAPSTSFVPAAFCQTSVGTTFVIDADGYFHSWLILGPLLRAGGGDPGARVFEDYLATDTVTEATVLPKKGAELLVVSTSITGIAGPTVNGQNPAAAQRVATWHVYHSPSFRSDHDVLFGQNIDNMLVYHACYLENKTAADIALDIVTASDSTAVTMLDNAVVGITHWNDWSETSFPIVLAPGVHRLMVKVFDGGGGSGLQFRLREHATGDFILDGDSRVRPLLASGLATVPAAPMATVSRYMDSAFFPGEKATVRLKVENGPVDVIETIPDTMTIDGAPGGAVRGQRIEWRNTNGPLTYTVKPAAPGGAFLGLAREVSTNTWFGYFGPQRSPTFPATLGTWLSMDIAAAGLAGAADVQAGEDHDIAITGSGHDVWDPKDDFHFVWRDWPADRGVIVQARLEAGSFVVTEERDNAGQIPNVWAKAGVMFRAFPERGSPYVFALIREGQGTPDPAVQSRPSSEAAAVQSSYWGDTANVSLPHWIQLEYRGGAVKARFAPDAGGIPDTAKWRESGTVALNLEGADRLLIGLAVTSHNNNQAVRCAFRNVTVQSICEPVRAVRSWTYAGAAGTIDGQPVQLYRDGEPLAVTLTLSDIRMPGNGCAAVGALEVRERLPSGWTATNISMNGVHGDGVITWNITRGNLEEGMTLTYTAWGPVPLARAQWSGEINETPSQGVSPTVVVGQTVLHGTSALGAAGGIEGWLLLGPYEQDVLRPLPAAAPAPARLARDYLTDGKITEATVTPEAGEQMRTNYALAASLRLVPVVTNATVNPGGVPTWFAWREEDARIDLQAGGVFGAQDLVMTHAVCYIEASAPKDAVLAVKSDDAVQVLLDGLSIHNNPVRRSYNDAAPDLVPVKLGAGVHVLMVKVFEADGDWEFGVSIFESDGVTPVVDGLRVCLDPAGCGTETAPTKISIWVGDANNDKAINIADAVFILGHLFAQGAPPKCLKAADPNDDDSLNIADAIVVLAYLFSSGQMRAPDGTAFRASAHPGCALYDVKDVNVPPALANGCATPCAP